MTTMTATHGPRTGFLAALTRFLAKDEFPAELETKYGRKTLYAIKDLPPYVLKDIGVTDF